MKTWFTAADWTHASEISTAAVSEQETIDRQEAGRKGGLAEWRDRHGFQENEQYMGLLSPVGLRREGCLLAGFSCCRKLW